VGKGKLLVAIIAAALSMGMTTASAQAFRVGITGGPASIAAGAHSDLNLSLTFPDSDSSVRNLTLQLPAGLLGNPNAVTACTTFPKCAETSKVGAVSSTAVALGLLPLEIPGSVYLIAPRGGEPARLGIHLTPDANPLLAFLKVLTVSVPPIDLEAPIALRAPGDFGLDTVIRDIPNSVTATALGFLPIPMGITLSKMDMTLYGTPPTGAKAPFLTNPTSCEPAPITVQAASWAAPSTFRSASTSFTPTGCDSASTVPFNPTLAVGPAQQQATQPTALSVTIGFPDSGSSAATQSHLKSAEVVLPVGTALSPGVGANGLDGCADAQFAVDAPSAPACPGLSKIGTVSFVTPLLGTLAGDVFLGAPTASEKLRLFAYATKGDVKVKLVGRVTPDPQTGQLTTTFTDLPRVPFTSFTLGFRGGDNAVLKAPDTCATNTASARLTPYARPASPVTVTATFATVNCPSAAFAPTLDASVAPTQATANTAMTMTIARGDDQPLLDGMNVSLPTGLLGRLASIPACPVAAARTGNCAGNTRVGTVTAVAGTGAKPASLTGPIYLTGPVDDGIAGLAVVVPAKVGPIDLGQVVVLTKLKTRADLGIDVTASSLPRIVGGVPLAIRSMKLALDRDGFLFNASSCATKTIRASFTGRGGATATSSAPYQATDCDKVAFTPSLDVGPQQQPADQPTGVTVTLGFPAGQAQSNLRSAEVVLPVGTALSPGVGAHGLEACSNEQFAVDATSAPSCPSLSKIGAVSLATPLLGELTGDVFLGTPTADAPLRLFVVAAKDAVRAKFVGTVTPDPQTGQLTTRFSGLPEVPFTAFKLMFRGGDDAVLKAPPTCGTNTATAKLEPYARPGTFATPSASFETTGCGAAAPFAPTLAVDVAPTQAAANTAMTMTIARGADQPLLDGMKISLPTGALGYLASIPACPVADARTGDCPEASRVGTVTAVAGTGAAPAAMTGPIYLTGVVDDGIAGLAVVVPAKVGPIDLGQVVVLNKLSVRPDVGIDVTTSNLPRIVGGVPLAIRSMKLALDRDGFLFNASSCAAKTIDATFTAQSGATAAASAPYQPTGCESVPFAPKLTAAIGGTVSAPSLTATIEGAPGQATLAGVQLTLPVQLAADLGALGKVCMSEAYEAGQCPANSLIGRATAVSPLIPVPLSGPVRLLRVPGRALPSLAIDMAGVMNIRLRADTDSAGGRLRSTVNAIPDVPLSSFTLELASGGLLKSDQQMLCTGTPKVDGVFTAHTGATTTSSAIATTPCRPTTTAQSTRLTATASLTGAGKGRTPSLKVKVRGSKLRTLRVTLPKQLRLNAKKLKTGGRALQGGKTLSRKKALPHTKTTVTAKATKATGSIELRLAKGALKRGKGLKVGKRITLKLRVTDHTGKTRTITVRVKPRR